MVEQKTDNEYNLYKRGSFHVHQDFATSYILLGIFLNLNLYRIIFNMNIIQF